MPSVSLIYLAVSNSYSPSRVFDTPSTESFIFFFVLAAIFYCIFLRSRRNPFFNFCRLYKGKQVPYNILYTPRYFVLETNEFCCCCQLSSSRGIMTSWYPPNRWLLCTYRRRRQQQQTENKTGHDFHVFIQTNEPILVFSSYRLRVLSTSNEQILSNLSVQTPSLLIKKVSMDRKNSMCVSSEFWFHFGAYLYIDKHAYIYRPPTRGFLWKIRQKCLGFFPSSFRVHVDSRRHCTYIYQ